MKVLASITDSQKIPTNSDMDILLDGGIERGIVTQLFGHPSSGKSNVALSLAVDVAKTGKKVLYMDTEGGISIDRIKQIAAENFSQVANNIMVFEPTSFEEQGDNINAIELWLRKNHESVDLFIVDSIVALYRVNDMESFKLHKELNKQMNILFNIAREYDIAVLITNQIYSAVDEEGHDDIRAVGGNILQYNSKVIIQLERGEEINQRIATLKRHRSIPEGGQAIFRITSDGIS